MYDIVIKIENISKQYRLGNVGLGTIGAYLTAGGKPAYAATKTLI
jgi:hypothetical protein